MGSDPKNLEIANHGRPASGYLPTLDGWRAIAIICVLCAHGGMFFFSDKGPHPSGRLEDYTSRGSGGVDIFFAISGFLICTLLIREQKKNGNINLKSFYIRRVFRILPPYLLYLAVLAVLAAMGFIVVQRIEWVACLLFFRNYIPLLTSHDIGWYTGHFWSLAVEEHFYLLWPAMLLLLQRRRATYVGLALILAITIWRTIDLTLHVVPSHVIERFDHRTDFRLDSLFWGCIGAIIFASESGRRSINNWINPIAWLICAAVLVVLTAQFFDRSPWRTAIAATVRPPLFAAMVVATVANPGWILSRFLEDARLRWIGRASYSLYIWQQLFLVVQLVPRPLPFGHWQEVPRAFICIFACATASYYLIEQPLVRVGHRLSRGQASASAASRSSVAVISSAGSSA
jgi:peptidoglycan/LPS O-acetylase OafA/YrhL